MTVGLEGAIKRIDAAVKDARRGLPEAVFYLVSRLTPLVNVDLFIRDAENRVLLTWRADQFYGPGWHIPGGIVRFKERWEDRIAAVAESELGASVSFTPAPLRVTQPMHPTRAVRGHFISLLFDCRLAAPLDDARRASDGAPQNGQWAWHSAVPDDLIAVHQRLYGDLLASTLGAQPSPEQPSTFVIDVDGVVAKLTPGNDYRLAEPIPEVIAAINQLYDRGHTIIMLTARGSKTGLSWAEVTSEQFARWGLKHHALRFGKPAADYYVDDRMISIDTLCAMAAGAPFPPSTLAPSVIGGGGAV